MSFFVTLDVGTERFMCLEDVFCMSMTMFVKGSGIQKVKFKKLLFITFTLVQSDFLSAALSINVNCATQCCALSSSNRTGSVVPSVLIFSKSAIVHNHAAASRIFSTMLCLPFTSAFNSNCEVSHRLSMFQ